MNRKSQKNVEGDRSESECKGWDTSKNSSQKDVSLAYAAYECHTAVYGIIAQRAEKVGAVHLMK